MRRICKGIVLIMAVALLTVGCSSNNTTEQTGETSSLQDTAGSESASEEASSEAELSRGEYKASDYITVTAYKNLEIQKSDIEPTDTDVQSYVEQLIADNATTKEIKDRAVKDGDTVNIDYVGKKDGEAFDGGTAQGYDLTIGSGTFIDGFEEGLIGVMPGETKNLDLTFPENYQSEDLAGQAVVFEVTVNYISESEEPEYTDEFVKSVTDYNTIAEYEQSIKDSVYQSNLEEKVLEEMLNNCTVKEYPESLLKYYEDLQTSYVKQLATMYGYTYEDYLAANSYTEETFKTDYLEPNSESYSKEDLAIEYIADNEGIVVSADDYETVLENYATEAGTTLDTLKEQYPDDELKEIYYRQKVVKLMADSAVIN